MYVLGEIVVALFLWSFLDSIIYELGWKGTGCLVLVIAAIGGVILGFSCVIKNDYDHNTEVVEKYDAERPIRAAEYSRVHPQLDIKVVSQEKYQFGDAFFHHSRYIRLMNNCQRTGGTFDAADGACR